MSAETDRPGSTAATSAQAAGALGSSAAAPATRLDRPRVAEAVAIGASAGAIAALSVVLPALRRPFPLPIFVVVHMPADKDSMLASLFASRCELPAKEAEDKEPIEGGVIYFAAPDYHLLVEANGCLSLSSDEPVLYSRPSIDVLFESAADAYGPGLIAVVLSGANADGANGVAAVVRAGGVALVQSPGTAEAQAMPLAALAAAAEARSLSLEQIALELREAAGGRAQ